MQPEQYEAWYTTPRGTWIGEEEYRLLDAMLAPLGFSTDPSRLKVILPP